MPILRIIWKNDRTTRRGEAMNGSKKNRATMRGIRFPEVLDSFVLNSAEREGTTFSAVVLRAVEEMRIGKMIERRIKDSLVRNIERYGTEDDFRKDYPTGIEGDVIPGDCLDDLHRFIGTRIAVLRQMLELYPKGINKDDAIGFYVREFFGKPSLFNPSMFIGMQTPEPTPKASKSKRAKADATV